MTDQITTSYIDLKLEKIAAQMAVSRSALTLSQHDDMLVDQVIYRLVQMVVTVPGVEEVVVPATWWDGLKEAEGQRSPIMRWWVVRHPVKHRTWRAIEVLPRFPELDKYRDPVRVMRLIRSWEADE